MRSLKPSIKSLIKKSSMYLNNLSHPAKQRRADAAPTTTTPRDTNSPEQRPSPPSRNSIFYDISSASRSAPSLPPLRTTFYPADAPSFDIDFGFDPGPDPFAGPTTRLTADFQDPTATNANLKDDTPSFYSYDDDGPADGPPVLTLPFDIVSTTAIAPKEDDDDDEIKRALATRIEALEAELAQERRKLVRVASRSVHCLHADSSEPSPSSRLSSPFSPARSSPSPTMFLNTPASELPSIPSIASRDSRVQVDASPDMTWALDKRENYGMEGLWKHERNTVYQHPQSADTLKLNPSLTFLAIPQDSSRDNSPELSLQSNAAIRRSPSPCLVDKALPPLPPAQQHRRRSRMSASDLRRRSAPCLA